MALVIRERRPGDEADEVEIYNACTPPHLAATVEDQLLEMALDTPDGNPLRLIALVDGTAAGIGATFIRPHYAAGRYRLDLFVRPEFRRRGIGRGLYDRLEAHARASGAGELRIGVYETDLAVIQTVLDREGFREVSRVREWELDLASFDLAPFYPLLRRLEAERVRILPIEDAGDPLFREELYALTMLTGRDIPSDVPGRPLPLEEFVRRLETEPYIWHASTGAWCDGRLIGFTVLTAFGEGRADIANTGVHPEYRGRGIATAVKARSAALAQAAGIRAITTANHTTNPAILAANTRLGFKRLPESITLVKRLEDPITRP